MTNDEIILMALIEYEENHYESNDDEWQKKVNDLIASYRSRVFKK